MVSPAFDAAVARHFPGAIGKSRALDELDDVVSALGFTPENTLASLGTCRDELTRGLRLKIQGHWGEAFDLSGLGGFLFAGRTGFAAASAHAPQIEGRARYLYLVTTHIGIGDDGTLGVCRRPGQAGTSTACGALMAFHDALRSPRLDLRYDPLDAEQSLLIARMAEAIPHDHLPDLAEITHIAHGLIRDDLVALAAGSLAGRDADYVLCTGVQIHVPEGEALLWRGFGRAWVDGEERPLPGWPGA